ncbi:MAG: hypothetical protein RL748_2210 [Pseudomonadota bacterium]|jgi:hypothetical protein
MGAIIFSRYNSRSSWLLPAIFIAFATFTNTAHANAKPTPNALEQARNYVLAACIINRYPGTPLADEADAWASGLVEFGNFQAATYVTLAKLAKSAPPPGMAQQGFAMKLQNCVDFSNSKKLTIQLGKVLQQDSSKIDR